MMVRQPLWAPVGLIHAANVIPVLRLSEDDEFTRTMLLEPLKFNALPYLPATQVAPVMVAVLLLPETSAAVVPEPASKVHSATRPGGRVLAPVVAQTGVV